MAGRRNWRRHRADDDDGAFNAPRTGASSWPNMSPTRDPRVNVSQVAASVRQILDRVSPGPSASKGLAGAKPNAASVVLRSSYGDAPRELVKASKARVTNNPASMALVNLTQKVVRTMQEKGETLDHVAGKNRPSIGLSSSNRDALALRGVSSTDKRANNACLSEHRPDPTPKGGAGTGRDFVHWCKKGDGKK